MACYCISKATCIAFCLDICLDRAKLPGTIIKSLLWLQMNEFFQKELAEQRQKQPQAPGWQRETNSSTIAPGDAKCVAAFLRLLAQVSHLQTVIGELKVECSCTDMGHHASCYVGACATDSTALELRGSPFCGSRILQHSLIGKLPSLDLWHHPSSGQTKSWPFPLAASQQALFARKGLTGGPHQQALFAPGFDYYVLINRVKETQVVFAACPP